MSTDTIAIHQAWRSFLGAWLSIIVLTVVGTGLFLAWRDGALSFLPHLTGLPGPIDTIAVDRVLVAVPWILIAVVLVITTVRWYATVYYLSPDRIVRRDGILSRYEAGKAYRDIRYVDAQQPFHQRLLGYGTVELYSAGTDTAEIRIANVARPFALRDGIRKRING